MHKVSEKAKKFYKKLIWDALDFIESYKSSNPEDKDVERLVVNFGYISINMFNDLKRVHASRKRLNLANIENFKEYSKEDEEFKKYLEDKLKEKEAIHVIENTFKDYLKSARKIHSKWNNVKAFEE